MSLVGLPLSRLALLPFHVQVSLCTLCQALCSGQVIIGSREGRCDVLVLLEKRVDSIDNMYSIRTARKVERPCVPVRQEAART